MEELVVGTWAANDSLVVWQVLLRLAGSSSMMIITQIVRPWRGPLPHFLLIMLLLLLLLLLWLLRVEGDLVLQEQTATTSLVVQKMVIIVVVCLRGIAKTVIVHGEVLGRGVETSLKVAAVAGPAINPHFHVLLLLLRLVVLSLLIGAVLRHLLLRVVEKVALQAHGVGG